MKKFDDLFAEFHSTYTLHKTAARKNRKQLEKDLSYAKDFYTKKRNSLNSHKKTYDELTSLIEKENTDVEKTKEEINKIYDVLRNMDLYDISEVRFLNDDVGYVKNRRIYKLDKNKELVPWKKKDEEEDSSEEASGEEDENLSDDDADDLFASLMKDL